MADSIGAFLKFTGIPGESTDKNHTGWVELLSFSWGLSRSGSSAVFEDFHFVMRSSKASPKLEEACTKGTKLGNVLFGFRPAGASSDVLSLKLETCTVSSFAVSGDILMQPVVGWTLEEVNLRHKKATLEIKQG